MNILITLLTVLDVFIALLIIALVLVQQSKSGGGLGTTFGGGGSDSLFGAHASTHLSRLTVIFASMFLIITLSLAIITAHRPKNESLAEINSILMSAPAAEKEPLTKLPEKQNETVPAAAVKTEGKQKPAASNKTAKSAEKDIDKTQL